MAIIRNVSKRTTKRTIMTDEENSEMKDFRKLMRKGLELNYYEGDVCEGVTECVLRIDDRGELWFFCDMDMGVEEDPLQVVVRKPFLLKKSTITRLGENQIRFVGDDCDDMATLVFRSPRVCNYMTRLFGLVAQE